MICLEIKGADNCDLPLSHSLGEPTAAPPRHQRKTNQERKKSDGGEREEATFDEAKIGFKPKFQSTVVCNHNVEKDPQITISRQ